MNINFFEGLGEAELPIVKGPFVTFLTSLTQPNANFLTLADDARNLALQIPQLSLPAQSALLNFTATALLVKINSVPTPASTAA